MGKVVAGQTAKENEYLAFKDQLRLNNFKLISTENFQGSIMKDYINSKWKASINSGKDDDGQVSYEIYLMKRQ